MKYLVTGANGYIGCGVVNRLLDKGCQVVVSDVDLEGVDERAERISGNIFEIENPYEYYNMPDVLVHLAWRDGFKHNSENHLLDLPLHYKFIQKLIDAGIKRVCIMGSMHEVGFYEGSIDEKTACNPMSLYGISKNALRNAVELYAKEHAVDFLWFRGFYIVGDSERGSSIFSKIVAAEKKRQDFFPFTTGKNQYDFLPYQVFCEQVVAAAMQNRVKGIINCCSGYPQRLSERVEAFIKEHGYSIKLQYGVFPERPYDSKAVWGNDSKIMEIMESAQE